jgi:hypothetical protein
VKFPISTGKGPAKLLLDSPIPFTWPALQVTPYQGAVQALLFWFQPVLVVQLAPLVLMYKANRASHSV